MAARYWVGGTATWDTTAGTKWATTSGGAGGAAVPTAADDVFFDAASTGVCTLLGAVGTISCRSLDCTGFTGTISHPNSTILSVGGSTPGAGNIALKFAAGMTYTLGHPRFSQITFASTSTTQQTITWAGKTTGDVVFNGAGGSWLFSDASIVGSTATVTLTSGTLDTNNQACSWGFFATTGSAVRAFTAGTSDFTLTGSGNVWNFNGTTNMTISMLSSTSTITGQNSGIIVNGSPVAFGSVTITGNLLAPLQSVSGTSFANLTRVGTAVKTDALILSGNITVTGTLTLNGNSITNRLLVQSSVLGTPRTITAATVVVTNADFQDIIGAGAGNWNLSAITGGSGDCGGNSGITFTTSATQTATGTASFSWSTHGWTTRVPLPQDDVVLSNVFVSSPTVTMDMPRWGRSLTVTGSGVFSLNAIVSASLYGSLTLRSGIGIGGSPLINLAGRGSHTITCAGVNLATWVPNISGPGGTYTLTDALASVNQLIVATGATFDTAGFALTVRDFLSVGTAVVILGASTVSLIGTAQTVPWQMSATGTLSAANATIIFSTLPSAVSRSFNGGGKTYGTLTYTVANSPGPLVITGANTFDTLNVGSGRVLTLPSGVTTNVTNWNVAGAVNGYQRLPGVAAQYVNVPDSAALSITSDIDIRCRVALNVWTGSSQTALLSKFGASGQFSYEFYRVGNVLALNISSNGTALSSPGASASLGLSDGAVSWVRVTWRASDGRVQFWKASGTLASPVSSDWTQVGANQTAAIGNIFDSTAALEIGSRLAATGVVSTGNFYRAQIRNNILDDGTGIVFDADFTTKAFGANTFTESSSNAATVTITGTTAQAGDGRVLVNSSTPGTQAVLFKPFDDGHSHLVKASGANTLLFNSDNVYLPAASSSSLFVEDHPDFSGSNDFDVRVRLAMDDWTQAGGCTLMSNNNLSAAIGLAFDINASGNLILFIGSTAGQAVSTAPVGVTDGAVKWVRGTLDIDNGASGHTARFYLSDDGVAWTQLGTAVTIAGVATTGDSVNPLGIGARASAGGSNLLKGKIYRAQIRTNILDDGTGIVLDFDASQRSTNTSDYLVIQDSKVGGAANWNAGGHSILVSNTTGWITTVSLTRTASDSFAMSDTAARTSLLARSASDVITLSDMAIRSLSLLRNASDVVTVSDAAARAIGLLRTAPDALTLSDSASRAIALERSAGDSLLIDDVATRSDPKLRTVDDVFTLDDAAVRSVGWSRTGVDVWVLDDAGDVSVQRHRVAEDEFAFADEAERLLGIGRTAEDTLSIVDSVTSWIGAVRFTEDAWDFDDEAVAYLGLILLPGADGQTSVTRVGVIALTRRGLLAHTRSGRIV